MFSMASDAPASDKAIEVLFCRYVVFGYRDGLLRQYIWQFSMLPLSAATYTWSPIVLSRTFTFFPLAFSSVINSSVQKVAVLPGSPSLSNWWMLGWFWCQIWHLICHSVFTIFAHVPFSQTSKAQTFIFHKLHFFIIVFTLYARVTLTWNWHLKDTR